jgi:acetaldehyde dehydrogenase/alcohol dehydrogenase
LRGRPGGPAAAFRRIDQEQVNSIVEAAFRAAFNARSELARLAADETGIGVYEHKVVKNAWSSLLIYEHIRNQRTVGTLSHDPERGITEVAQPIGPVLALTPLTNPTSTIIFKILICLRRGTMIVEPAPPPSAAAGGTYWPKRLLPR